MVGILPERGPLINPVWMGKVLAGELLDAAPSSISNGYFPAHEARQNEIASSAEFLVLECKILTLEKASSRDFPKLAHKRVRRQSDFEGAYHFFGQRLAGRTFLCVATKLALSLVAVDSGVDEKRVGLRFVHPDNHDMLIYPRWEVAVWGHATQR